MADPCVCSHDPDEHNDVMGCVAQRVGPSGYVRPCLCSEYEADVCPF